MINNDWDPVYFEEVMQQRIIDGAVEAALEALRVECRKTDKEITPESEQKIRLEMATCLRGKIERLPLIDDE